MKINPNHMKILGGRRDINSSILKNETYKQYKNLHHNSKAMYSKFGALQKALKPYCYNDGREWSMAERLNLKNNVDILNLLSVSHFSCMFARSPFSVFFVYTNIMWEDYIKGNKVMFEKVKNFGEEEIEIKQPKINIKIGDQEYWVDNFKGMMKLLENHLFEVGEQVSIYNNNILLHFTENKMLESVLKYNECQDLSDDILLENKCIFTLQNLNAEDINIAEIDYDYLALRKYLRNVFEIGKLLPSPRKTTHYMRDDLNDYDGNHVEPIKCSIISDEIKLDNFLVHNEPDEDRLSDELNLSLGWGFIRFEYDKFYLTNRGLNFLFNRFIDDNNNLV